MGSGGGGGEVKCQWWTCRRVAKFEVLEDGKVVCRVCWKHSKEAVKHGWSVIGCWKYGKMKL